MIKSITVAILVFFSFGPAQLPKWTYEYNGPASNADEALAITEGSDGNLYAAGFSYVTASDNDFIVISLDTAGQQRWLYDYNGPGHATDGATAVVHGQDGNVYATGWAHRGASGDIDFCVASADSEGQERWVYRYNGPGNYIDNGLAIAYGRDGNIYAAGYTFTFASGVTDLLVVSLTAAGGLRWLYRYDGGGLPWNGANSLVYGPDDHIYAAGYCGGAGGDVDLCVIRFDTLGNEDWIYKHDGPGGGDDEARSIVFGADGRVYCAGYSSGVSTSLDLAIISLTTGGSENWVYRYCGSGNKYDMAKALAYGPDNNLYAAGFSYETGSDSDFVVVSVDTGGSARWHYTYNGPYDYKDEGLAISCGADSNIYAAGYSYGINTFEDFTVIGFKPTGDPLWVYRRDGTYHLKDQADAVICGSDGNVYAAGECFNTGTIVDFTVVSLDPLFGIENRPAPLPGHAATLSVSSHFRDRIALRFAGGVGGALKIKLYDVAGELVYADDRPLKAAAPCVIEGERLRRLACGTYFLAISRSGEPPVIKKLIKY